MDIGIGLPNAVPGVDRDSLLEFARRADQRGFSTLGTIDRIVYPNFEPLLTLAAAATVTERVKLGTTVLLAPLRPNATMLAKQALTLDDMSGGRLVLGLGIGARDDDYEISGLPRRAEARPSLASSSR
jgi:alkanesulfonate monooxygenase SsuD/methylene tetrahydromethanopterin reductase-like flavin-dependent oxidoreductase (luciferase family)